MLLSVLLDMISEQIPYQLVGIPKERELHRFCFLQEHMVLDDEACLYIGKPQLASKTSSSVVIMTTSGMETAEYPCGSDIDRINAADVNTNAGDTISNHVEIRISDCQYLECLNLITKAFFHEQEREEEFNRLLSRPVEQTPFHEIIDHAAVFLDRSLILTDLSFHVVDFSTSRAITDPIWKTNVKRGFCSYEFVEAMNELIPDHSLPTTPEPFFVNCDASKENKLCSMVFYNQRPIGYLVLLDNEKGILPYHLQYLPRIGQILILSLKHVPNFQSLFINAAENIFLNLLEGKTNDASHLQMLNATLKLPKAMRCLVFVPKNSSRHDRFYMQRNLYSLFPKGSVFLYQNDVVAIVSDEDSRAFSLPGFCEEKIKNVKEVGVSSVFRSLSDFPDYLGYAKMACDIAERLGQDEVIHYYDRYQFFHILSTCQDERLLRAYIHPAFDLLREYDLANDAALLKTLQSYIDNGLRAKETAAALYLHRNTLAYRLNKIRELTEIDFENLETVFRLSCSFRINELLQIY